MKSTRLALSLAACAISAPMLIGATSPPVVAASKCIIPKDWGRLVNAFQPNPGSNLGYLVFEATDGTIRAVAGECKSPAKPLWEVGRE